MLPTRLLRSRRPRRAELAYFFRLFWSVCVLLGLAGGLIPTAQAQPSPGAIYILEIDGIIGPPNSGYLQRALADAARQQAALIVIRLDTPGGLESSMREMTQAVLASPVPVVVYVSPSGARAASAGLFLMAAAHVAVMAPGTNTGAATPVSMSGEDIDDTLAAKAVNDAAATIRALAAARGRNVEWHELAVREAVSITADEALALNVIDLIARDLDDLQAQLDGQTISTAAGPRTLNLAGAARVDAPMNLAERILHVISDPNIAFLLLSIGSLGLIAEMYNPGSLLPGITGVIALILAFYSLGNLPTNWAGVALLALGVILFIAELNTEATGVLGVGALVAFVLGGLMLFRPFEPLSPVLPRVSVNPWLLGGVTVALAGSLLLIFNHLARTRRSPIVTGAETFVGRTVRVHADLSPQGSVWFEGQTWTAESPSGARAAAGSAARIVGRRGLTLLVEPILPDNPPDTHQSTAV